VIRRIIFGEKLPFYVQFIPFAALANKDGRRGVLRIEHAEGPDERFRLARCRRAVARHEFLSLRRAPRVT